MSLLLNVEWIINLKFSFIRDELPESHVNHDVTNNNHNPATNGGNDYRKMYEKCNDMLNQVQIQQHVNNNNNWIDIDN